MPSCVAPADPRGARSPTHLAPAPRRPRHHPHVPPPAGGAPLQVRPRGHRDDRPGDGVPGERHQRVRKGAWGWGCGWGWGWGWGWGGGGGEGFGRRGQGPSGTVPAAPSAHACARKALARARPLNGAAPVPRTSKPLPSPPRSCAPSSPPSWTTPSSASTWRTCCATSARRWGLGLGAGAWARRRRAWSLASCHRGSRTRIPFYPPAQPPLCPFTAPAAPARCCCGSSSRTPRCASPSSAAALTSRQATWSSCL
jgi:hypothetical protein